ncbi:MAG: hypothetical protein ACJ77R_13920 [Gemmatimonadaceae bacterium]
MPKGDPTCSLATTTLAKIGLHSDIFSHHCRARTPRSLTLDKATEHLFHVAGLQQASMTTQWQPFREPLRATLLRTVLIALVAGVVVARLTGSPRRWPLATLVMLWPSFGGHWVELWYLNWLRPRLSAAPGVQVLARIAVWFVGGIVLGLGMALTTRALIGIRRAPWPAWWLAGFAFIGVELIAQLALHLRGRPSFYNGRG